MIINKKIILSVELEVLTGLHIGGSETGFDIGGIDDPVVKDVITGEPYIPGSSLKGKLRSLLELFNNDSEEIGVLFGNSKTPTRIIVRDLFLLNKEELESYLGKGIYTEMKAENNIDKLTSKANAPRFIERIPKGAKFRGEIIITSYNEDNCDEFISIIKQGMDMLKDNYLGGSGSRGYGKVAIKITETIEKCREDFIVE